MTIKLSDEEFKALEEDMENATHNERLMRVFSLFPKLRVHMTLVDEVRVDFGSGIRGFCNKFRVTVTNEGRKMQFSFQDSINNHDKGKKPTVVDVLFAIVTDSDCYEGSTGVEDFIGSFGYEDNDANAIKAYKGCERAYNSLHRVFGEDYKFLQACVRGF